MTCWPLQRCTDSYVCQKSVDRVNKGPQHLECIERFINAKRRQAWGHDKARLTILVRAACT